MKTMFAVSAVVSGIVSFFGVRALRKHEQKKLDTRTTLLDEWFSRPM
jgi:hypothetical protein